jgi:hypothetical protein
LPQNPQATTARRGGFAFGDLKQHFLQKGTVFFRQADYTLWLACCFCAFFRLFD